MNQFISFQLSLSTAEVESLYFSGVASTPDRERNPLLQDGVYRIVAGELFRVVDGLPTSLLPSVKDGD